MKNDLFKITHNNSVEFFYEGEFYYQSYLRAIDQAKSCIHLQTYIFNMDPFGTRVHHALIQAAHRGVKVYVMVDSVGSRLLNKEDERKLIHAGVYFMRFNGLNARWLYRWGRRLHHKVLICDGELSILGGINIVSSLKSIQDIPQLDFAILMKGPINEKILQYCENLFCNHYHFLVNPPRPKKTYPFNDGVKIKLLVNDWVHRRMHITRQYTHITQSAQKDILIINSYFFPRKNYMNELVAAKKRGVRVRLILPKWSDWPSYILATEYLYDYFLKNGVEIYQWNKSILHGKLALVDDSLTTLGSFNLNYTSYQQNLEMNVNIYSETFSIMVKNEIEELIKNGCSQIVPEDFLKQISPLQKIKRFLYYLLLATIANFSVGLLFQEEKNRESRFFSLLRVVLAFVFLIVGISGLFLPVIPGIPFLMMGFLLVYKQILFNEKREWQAEK